MAIYFYAPTETVGLSELISNLGALRVTKYDGKALIYRGSPLVLTPTDSVICWGSHIPPISGIRILNGNSKFTSSVSINLDGNLHENLNAVELFKFKNKLAYLTKLNDNENERRDSSIVPYSDIPGFASFRFEHTHVFRVHAFNGVIIANEGKTIEATDYKSWKKPSEKVSNGIYRTLENLELDFGMFRFFRRRNTATLHRVSTAPDLSKWLVEVYTAAIKSWLEREPKVIEYVEPIVVEV